MSKVLASEFLISIAFNSYGAIKEKQVPWPGTMIRIAIAFGILGVIAQANEEIAELLGGAFLLASLVNVASNQGPGGKWSKTFGAQPPANGPNFPYWTLGFKATP